MPVTNYTVPTVPEFITASSQMVTLLPATMTSLTPSVCLSMAFDKAETSFVNPGLTPLRTPDIIDTMPNGSSASGVNEGINIRGIYSTSSVEVKKCSNSYTYKNDAIITNKENTKTTNLIPTKFQVMECSTVEHIPDITSKLNYMRQHFQQVDMQSLVVCICDVLVAGVVTS